MIRPFSERMGLKADLIRLQRAEVAINIAKMAKQQALEENIILQPLPNKFLVPFFEKASLEELDTDLVERWSRLLLSASQKYNSRFILYTNILSNLGPEDVRFLDRMVRDNRGSATIGGNPRTLGDTPGLFKYEEIKQDFDSVFDDEYRTDMKSMMRIIEKYEWPGIYVRYIGFIDDEGIHQDISRYGRGFPHDEQFSISALESQGVIRSYEYYKNNIGFNSLFVCAVTYLGEDFYRNCTRDKKASAG